MPSCSGEPEKEVFQVFPPLQNLDAHEKHHETRVVKQESKGETRLWGLGGRGRDVAAAGFRGAGKLLLHSSCLLYVFKQETVEFN